ncbi:YbjN domain-containing protein [Selenomonadales bacterium OttesenSCG-928-I06]|nr:YbjN domain-containing protein [Selenomonadales bacterium OttesenSCG-928-I06]
MNVKAEKFQEFLKEQQITVFEVEEITDDFNSVVFRSRMEVENQMLPTIVILDDSIYALLRIQIAEKLVKDSNKAAVWELINELNQKYKIFKYYVTEDGSLVLDCCMPCTNDTFEGNMVRMIIDVALQHLIEFYPAIMKTVWSGEKQDLAMPAAVVAAEEVKAEEKPKKEAKN